MFDSVFVNGSVTPGCFFLTLAVAFFCGCVFSFLCMNRSASSDSLGIALAFLPMAVAVVIALVNGSLGTGIAIAGAFGLVRFRSAPGTAREIAALFISMAGGLAFGMGYLVYGALFLLLSGLLLFAYQELQHGRKSISEREKLVRITIPEILDYSTVFDDVFARYTVSAGLEKVKSTNMGSMFRLTYRVLLRPEASEKAMLDELRIRNGNLEIECLRADLAGSEL